MKQKIEILDCTLRDGAHHFSGGFSPEFTKKLIEILIDSGVKTIEFGKAKGLGANNTSIADRNYLEETKQLMEKANLGMFALPHVATKEDIDMLSDYPIEFLRVGTNATEVKSSVELLSYASKKNINLKYSLMKAYSADLNELVKNSKIAQENGAQSITIMDSAGTMLPDEVKRYTEELIEKLDIPIGFHGHNNLGLSIGNSIVAAQSNVSSIDGSVMGIARSAGNAPTELLGAVFDKYDIDTGINWRKLLAYIDNELMQLMEAQGILKPLDIVVGYAGFHSNYYDITKKIAEKYKIDVYSLIIEISMVNKINPSEEQIEQIARKMMENE